MERAAVDGRAAHHLVAGLQQREQDRRDGRHAGAEDERLLGAVGRRQLLLDRHDGRVLVARIEVLPGATLVVAPHRLRILEHERGRFVDRGRERGRRRRALRRGGSTWSRIPLRSSLTNHASRITITIHECEMLAAGADDGLDELPIRVLVGALHQLCHVLPAVRGFIIRAAASRMRRRDCEPDKSGRRIEAQPRHLHGVAQRRRLRPQRGLAKPVAEVEAGGAQMVRRRPRRHRADDDRLRGAGRGQLLEQPRRRRRADRTCGAFRRASSCRRANVTRCGSQPTAASAPPPRGRARGRARRRRGRALPIAARAPGAAR